MKHLFYCEDDSNLTVNCQSLVPLQAGKPLECQIMDYCEGRVSRYEANYRARNKGKRNAKKNKK